MRRPNRNIEIFSISVLDLFASALGAFVMIAVILFPYYIKDQEARAKEASGAAASTGEGFLIVSIDWGVEGADVDLYVTDPQGREYSFSRPNRGPDAVGEAKLSYDSRSGPGMEVWQSPAAAPGEYRVEYRLHSAPPGGLPVEVKGQVFDRSGRQELPPRALRMRGERQTAGTVVVAAGGRLDVR